MKNKKNTIMLIVIIISLVILTWDKSYSYEMKENLPVEQEVERKEFGIYYQIENEQYEEKNEFPKQGYLLNEEKTECYEYGSNNKVKKAVTQSLTKGVIDGTIIVTSQKSIYCKIYFDKDDIKPTINTFALTGNTNGGTILSDDKLYTHINKVNYTLTWNDDDAAQICIKEDNGECTETDWKQIEETSKNDSIIISSTDGLKTIKAYLKDKANNVSEVQIKNITLDTINPTITLTEDNVTENSIIVNVTAEDTNGISSVTCSANGNGETKTGEYNDSAETCTFNELESGTQYTITGEATDESGRKSTSDSIKATTKQVLTEGQKKAKEVLKILPNGISDNLLGGMYRFVGACNAGNNNGTGCNDIVDNFVCFGYNDSNTDCVNNTDDVINLDNDYIYRIIGITSSGQMKLIKNTAITEETEETSYVWHRSEKSNTNWPNSDIFKRLNGQGTGDTQGTKGDTNLFIDSTTSGINYLKSSGTEEETKWYKKIENHTWRYGDIHSEETINNSAKSIYSIEGSFNNTIQARIGLIYLNDFYYSYASSGTDSSNTNCRWSSAGCMNSWMHITNNGKSSETKREWTMTRFGKDMYGYDYYLAWELYAYGDMSRIGLDTALRVRPVFYLNSDIPLSGGTGTSSDPFIIEK